MKPKNLIVFDMDGVIVDVSNSYRDVVRQTARVFFSPARASEKLPEPLFELSDLAAVKQSGGLNNDWDLSYVVINLLFSLLPRLPIKKNQNPWLRYRETMRFCEVSPITAFLRSTQKPLTTLLKQGGKPEDAFITGLHTGDVGSGNVIKQIFQELYLGAALFKSTYGLQPAAYRGAGYILREKLLIDRSTLEEIGRGNILAVATGRPAAEAEYPLNHYKLKHLFTVIVTLDDCIEAEHRMLQKNGKAVSLSKPDPFMLDTIAESLKESVAERYYVGDMPDDMLAAAASRFGFKSIGILAAAADKSGLKRDLQKAGADYTVDDFSALKKIIL